MRSLEPFIANRHKALTILICFVYGLGATPILIVYFHADLLLAAAWHAAFQGAFVTVGVLAWRRWREGLRWFPPLAGCFWLLTSLALVGQQPGFHVLFFSIALGTPLLFEPREKWRLALNFTLTSALFCVYLALETSPVVKALPVLPAPHPERLRLSVLMLNFLGMLFQVSLISTLQNLHNALLHANVERLSEANKEIASQREKLVESARMAVLGQMASGVAHEVNNPLSVIVGHVGILRSRMQDGQVISPAELQASLSKMEAVSMRIADIVKGLRALSRDVEGEPLQRRDLSTMVLEALSFLRARCSAYAIDLRIQTFEGPLEVDCKPSQVSQIVLNLVGNAIDAVKGSPGAWVSVTVTRKESVAVITVADSGPGIPEGLERTILEPFYTTKAAGKGTGLGLAVSLGLARGNGGDLVIERREGSTVFVLSLPLPPPATAANVSVSS